MYKLVEIYAFMPPNPPSYKKNDFRVQYIETDKRKIPYIFYRANVDDIRRDTFTFLYTHGNAEDLGKIHYWMKYFRARMNVNILTYDYTGYGYNGKLGKTTEDDCYKDIETVYTWCLNNGFSASRIILWGRSIGSGPSIHLAAKLSKYGNPCAGLILQSPFTSVVSVITDKLRWFPFLDIFKNYKKISKVSIPVFIIHGHLDNIVPYAHSQELASKLKANLWKLLCLNNAGHNDIELKCKNTLCYNIMMFIQNLK